MNKLIVSVSIIGILLLCWGKGAASVIPPDYSGQITAYQQFAEEQVSLEAFGSAIEYYNKMIELDKSKENYIRLAEIYGMAGMISKQYELLDECVTLYPDEKDIYKQIIYFYFQQGNFDTCAKYLESYAKINGWEEEFIDIYFDCVYRFELQTKGYEEAGDIYGGLCLVKAEEGWSYLNKKYKKENYPGFEDASPKFGSILGVTLDGKANFIDGTGMKYLDSTSQYRKTWSFSGGLALVQYDDLYGYVNSQFKLVLEGYEQAGNFNNGIAAVKKDGSWMLIDSSGGQVGKETYTDIKMDKDKICSFGERVFAQKGDAYIMLDTDGKQIGKNTYEDVKPFNRGKYAAVKSEGMWGYVNADNEWVIPPKFEDAESFGEKLAAVSIENKWGFISEGGRLAIDPQFEAAGHINSGIAPVKLGGLWYYLELIK